MFTSFRHCANGRLVRTVMVVCGLGAVAHVRPAAGQVAAPVAAGVTRTADGVATFDEAWRAIRETYVDESLTEADWTRLRDEFRPRAAAAGTPEQVRDVLRALLARIGRSHFDLVPSSVHDRMTATVSGPIGTPGFDITPLGGEAVITRLDPAGPAGSAGVKPGWVVEAIGSEPLRVEPSVSAGAAIRDFRLWATAQALMRGPVGSHVSLRVRDEADRVREVDVARAPEPGEPVTLGHLPTFVARMQNASVSSPGGGHVRVVAFNVWMVPLAAEIDRVLFEARQDEGVVLDLRHNPGGVLSMLMGLSGHFLAEPQSLGTLRTRDSELKLLANPRLVAPDGRRVGPITGRLAILVDETSYSASEIFAAGMQSIGRARIFGSRTPGGALPAMLRRLPNGDVLEYAIGDFVTAAGTRIEGRGVEPDVTVAVTRRDVAAGRDPVLDAAVAWAGEAPAGGHR